MITKKIDENIISCIPEDSDDLLILRRLVKKDDKIVGETTRVIKRDRDFSRPDRGERIKIRLALKVEKISLDNVLDRLRVSGTITESNNESVPHGSHHSFTMKIDQGFNIVKKRWNSFDRTLLSKHEKNGFVLIAIDSKDCGIGRLKGTHLQFLPNIYSGAGGKRYKTEFKIERFFEDVNKAVATCLKKEDEIIIFGPGETKKKFTNFLGKKISGKTKFKVIDGIDSGGEDGIYLFTKSDVMKQEISDSKLARTSSIIDEVMLRVNKKSRKFTMGVKETQKANEFGAVESVVFSDKCIQENEEDEIINFMNDLEEKGAKTFSVDSSTDIGLRVDGLGGIVSLLRFPIDS